MGESEIVLSGAIWVAITAVMLAAGLTQGALGFGFPAVSTPILVLLTDVKTAIVLNLLPNFAVNVISIVRGGNWRASIGRYWPVALWVLVGSFLGARFLIVAPQEPIRFLLGLAIFAYLYQGWLAHLDWGWLARKERLSAMVFGLTGGFFSGTVNQALPALLIYFTLLGLELTVMTQILTLCFLGGKVVQAGTLAAAGAIRIEDALANVPLTVAGVTGLYAGIHVQRRVRADTYKRVIRYVLFVIAVILLWQGAPWFVSAARAAEVDAAQSRPWARSPHGAMLERVLPPSIEPRELPDPGSPGAHLMQRYCMQCHHLANPRMHTAGRWKSVVDRMVWRMRGNGNLGEVMKDLMSRVKAPSDAEVETLTSYLQKYAQVEIDPAHPGLRTESGQIFSLACSQCHALPDPRRHTAREWPAVVARMKRHMSWANVITGPPQLGTSPELKTEEIVRFLQRHAAPERRPTGT